MTVQLEKREDGTAIVTFNRPHAHNALDLAAMSQFSQIVQQIGNDPTLRVVILTGAGEMAFCSGGDLVELSRYPTEADAEAFITTMGDALLTLERLSVPVIAAINGYALGGGSEIALACDLRFADEAARLGLVQVRLALTPGWGAGQRLMRLIGYSRAMAILLQGQPMTAQTAHALGLVNHIVPAGQALPYALDFAQRYIIGTSPDVVRAIKTLLQAGLNQPYEEALWVERRVFPALWAAEPHLSAVEAFLSRKTES